MQNLKRFKSNSVRFGVSICAGALALVAGNSYRVQCKKKDETVFANEIEKPKLHNTRTRKIEEANSLKEAVNLSRDLIQRIKDETGTPGIVVGVSINGRSVYQEGIGYSDLENRVPCSYKTNMRIASISKCITAIAAAKLYENGLLDLDKPINEYLPDYPLIKFNDETVNVTCRQLMSHTSGIRHYGKVKSDAKTPEITEYQQKEFLSKENYKSIAESVSIFKDDPLLFKPGSKYNYTTYGYTLLSFVMEKASNETFPAHMKKMFRQMDMKYTFGDVNDELIYNRSRYYIRSNNGKLINAPYVDNSSKWAGGGLVSTVGDLLKFANVVLYSAQTPDNVSQKLPGFLKQSTIKLLWTIISDPKMIGSSDSGYGLGWCVVTEGQEYGSARFRPYYIHHTGGAAGASSVVLILPKKLDQNKEINEPLGICVSMLANMQNVKLSEAALEIANLFQNVKS